MANDYASTDLEFKNVSFKYHGSTKWVIKNLSFSVRRGECIGIKGVSGSGKSTLLHLICNLLKPTEGIILSPINDFKPHTGESSSIAIVEQDVVLFHRSLLFNVTLKECPTLADISFARQIVKSVGLEDLWTDGTIEGVLGDGGRAVSGGQRQRIGLARALFSSAKLIVLDEFTSALDGASERMCLEILSKYKGIVSIVLVSHRDEPLRLCDRILDLGG